MSEAQPPELTPFEEQDLALREWLRKVVNRVSATIAGLVFTVLMIPLELIELVPGVHWVTGPLLVGAFGSVTGLGITGVILFDIGDRLLPKRVPTALGDGSLASDLAAVVRSQAHVAIDVSPYVRFCASVAQMPQAAAALLLGIPPLYLMATALPKVLPAPLAFFAGLASVVTVWLSAVLAKRPDLASLPSEAPEPPSVEPVPLARIRGADLLEDLKRSPFYRKQVRAEIILDGVPAVWRNDATMSELSSHYPSLGAQLADGGITTWSESQARALRTILHRSGGSDSAADFIFEGEAGSGRSTLALALMLGAMLNGEASVFCVGGRQDSSVEGSTGVGLGPVTRFDDLLSADQRVRVARGFGDVAQRGMEPSGHYSAYFTDARYFCQTLSPTLGLIERLRYVIIDHPERLARNELTRMRLAIARLRFTAALLGRELVFIVLVPPIDNAQAVAKWLLNHDQVEPVLFDTWPAPAHVALWQAPFGIDPTRAIPRFERGGFVEELQDLVTELAAAADRRFDEAGGAVERAHIGVIDAHRVLGPEARRQLHQRCIDAIRRGKRHDSDELLALDIRFDVLGGDELRVAPADRFDILVTVGIGAHPGRLVGRLRNSLHADGVLITVSDESPDDLASVRAMARPGWQPARAHVAAQSTRSDDGEPRLLVPEYSAPVMQYELAAFLAANEGESFPLDRLLEVYPTRAASDLLHEWWREGRVEVYRSFRASSRGDELEYSRFVRPHPGRIKVERWRVPWGCVTRDVLEVYDVDAGRDGHLGGRRDLSDRVDHERMFVDLYPGAYTRDDPNSLHIRDVNLERTLPGDSVRRLGELIVDQPAKSESIIMQRKRARFHVEVARERLAPVGSRGRRVARSSRDYTPTEDERSQPAVPGIDHVAPLSLPGGSARAFIGQWAVLVRESLRDVVKTQGTMVVASHNMQIDVRPGDLSAEAVARTYETGAVHLFLPAEGAELGAARGFANVLERYLKRRFLQVEHTLRVDVLRGAAHETGTDPIAAELGVETTPRLMIRSLYSGEFGAFDSVGRLLRSEWRDVLRFARDLLDSCDCSDGCAACCGRLGTISSAERDERSDHDAWLPEDIHSRKATLALIAALDGRASSRPQDDAGDPARFRFRLYDAVRRVVGTPRARFADGAFHRSLSPWMSLEHVAPEGGQSALAPCRSYDAGLDGDVREEWLGWYSSNANEIVVRDDPDPDRLASTVLHEYVHNWQYKGRLNAGTPDEEPVFDDAEHGHSAEALEGLCGRLLVIEGVARWAQQQFHGIERRSPVHTVEDRSDWDEYKVGYFYIEGIVSEFGVAGLFEWLRFGERWGAARPLAPGAKPALPPAHPTSSTAAADPGAIEQSPRGIWAWPVLRWLWRRLHTPDGTAAPQPRVETIVAPESTNQVSSAESVVATFGSPPRGRNGRLEAPFTHREALRAFGLLQEAETGTFDGLDIVGFEGDHPSSAPRAVQEAIDAPDDARSGELNATHPTPRDLS